MTWKGLLDGIFISGLLLLWADALNELPPSVGTMLLVTVPVAWRILHASGKGRAS